MLVENSVVRQGNGLVIGTGTGNEVCSFHNITWKNCTATGTLYGCHIKFKGGQTGSVSGVLFEDVVVRSLQPTGAALVISTNGQNLNASEVPSRVTINDVMFRDIDASQAGGRIAGFFMCNGTKAVQRQPCEGIVLEDVRLGGAVDGGCAFNGVHGRGERVSPASCVPPR